MPTRSKGEPWTEPSAPTTDANRETSGAPSRRGSRGPAPITDVFAPDMVWRIEGHSVASREYRDRQEFIDEVLAPFGARFAAGERFRPVDDPFDHR